MKQNVIIIGAATHLGMAATIARLEQQGMDVQVVSPEDAPKSLTSLAHKLTNETLIEVKDLQLEITSATSYYPSGKDSRRERRAKERFKK